MASSIRTCFFALFAIQTLTLLEGKVQKGTLQFGGENDDPKNWQFVSKFGYGLGTSEYKIRFRLPDAKAGEAMPLNYRASQAGAQLELILDEDWEKVQTFSSCKARHTVARRTHRLSFKEDGEWSGWETGTVSQNVRPHIWFFIMSLCDEDLSPTPLTIEYEVHMTQGNGSQFSVEMQGMMTYNCLVLLALVAFLVRYCRRCQVFANSAGQLHPVIWALSTAICLQFAAQSLHTLHLLSYQSNGTGILFLDWLSEVFFMLGQVVQTTLLIAIAMGYTLLSSRSNDCMFVVKAIAAVSLIIHVALVSFGKMNDHADKYHENEGAVGWVLLSVRLMLLGWFVVATQATQKEGGLRLDDFMNKFRLAGAVYFLAYPVLFVLVQVFAAYLRHPILQIGLIAMTTFSNVCLGELFLSRGTYFKVSALSSSFLPGSHSSFDKTS